jgi:NAD(P)-dependent dehydrogenase (short-subunit alcohol dehydrogenase family)
MRPLHLFAALFVALSAGLVARTAAGRDATPPGTAGPDSGARYGAWTASPGTGGGGHSGSLDPAQLVALITGSTDGLGREVARRLAADGHHVIIHGRNRERGEALVAEIEAEGTGSARFYAADFASLDAVRGLADAVLRDYDRLDVLVNNAGIWSRGDDRRVSADGHELQFAVNYLAGYLLTHRLLPLLRASAPSRIINVASAAQAPIDFDDVMLERGYSGGRGYAQSKLAQVMFTFDLARQLDGTGVTVNALHPSTLMDTQMVRDAGVAPRTSIDDGARAVLRLVLDPDIGTGGYYDVLRKARAHAQAYDEAALERLRRLSDELTDRSSARPRGG